MAGIKIKIPKGSKSFVSMASIKRLNPNLKIVKIRKKYSLRKHY